MDAASQLQHYSSLDKKPVPPTAPSDSPPQKPPTVQTNTPKYPNANQQPTNAYVGSTLTNETPDATMSDNNWPDAPVQVTATPPPITPTNAQSPILKYPSSNPTNPPPDTAAQTVTVNHQSFSHHFPFMLVTVLVMVALIGFAGSFFYFKSKGVSQRAVIVPQITPPVTLAPTAEASEPTPNANPFAQPGATASANPFAQNDEGNPFDNVSDETSATGAAYTNPFETTQ